MYKRVIFNFLYTDVCDRSPTPARKTVFGESTPTAATATAGNLKVGKYVCTLMCENMLVKESI